MRSNNTKMASSSQLNQVSKTEWENLRKQARQLENEIDAKLVSFSKLCSSFTTTRDLLSDSSNMLNASSSDTLFETLSIEIEQLLKKLTLINNKMTENIGVSNDITDATNANVHTLQRHREILRDYTHEYDKTKRNIINYKEREKLLNTKIDLNMNQNTNNVSIGLNNRQRDTTSLYLKEYDHLKNSHSLIDQQIEMAEITKENLHSQKQAMMMIQQKLNTLAHKFPLINSLLQRTKFKKRKDSIILAVVIAICIIILLLYVF